LKPLLGIFIPNFIFSVFWQQKSVWLMDCIYPGVGDALQYMGQAGSVQLTVVRFYEMVRHN
jgi:hypothetical protein